MLDLSRNSSSPWRPPLPRPSTIPTGVRGVVHGHVTAAVNVLRARLAEPWTLDALATEVHLSSSQLMRSFDATVDMPPMAYLRRLRVERLAMLLVSTDLLVGAAARAMGWDNS